MADNATIDSPAGLEDATDKKNAASGSSGQKLGAIIPGQSYPPGSGFAPVLGIGTNPGALNSKESLVFNDDSRVYVQVQDINLYDQVFLRYGYSQPYELIKHKQDGLIWFSLKENAKSIGSLSEGEIVWVELHSSINPKYSGLISYYLTYSAPEEKKEGKKTNQQEAEQLRAERENQAKKVFDVLINLPIGGVVGALAAGFSGSAQATSVTAKAAAANSGLSNQKSADNNLENNYDQEQSQETETSQQKTLSSTLEASAAGSQTISQGGTVSSENSAQISASGTTENITGGGIISQSGTVTGNSTGQIQGGATVSSQSSTQVLGSESAAVSATSQTQGSVQNQTNISGTASAEAALNAKISASAPTQASVPGSANPTVSQSSTAAASGVISSGGTAAMAGGVYFGGGTTAGSGQISTQPQQRQAQPTTKSPLEDQQQASASVNQQAKIKQSSGEDSSAAQKPAPQQSPAKPKQPQAPLPGKGSVDGVNAGDSKQEKPLELNQSLVATASNSGTLPPKIPASEQPLPKAPKGMEGILGKLAGSNAQIGKILSAKNGNDEVIPRSNPLGGSTVGSAPEQAREGSPSARDRSSEKAHNDPSLGAPGAKGQLPQKSKGQEPLPGQQPKENAPGEDEDRNKQEGSEDEDSEQDPETLVDDFARQNVPQKTSRNAKVDNAEIERLTKEANRLLNSFLLEQSAVIWAAAIPSLGLSILLGMVLGDFIWLAKGYIIKGILNRLLTTEQLKKRTDEIASQIKISLSVKINIFLFNLVAIVFPVMAILLILATGCNYPVSGKQPVFGYRLSAIGAIIGDSCQPFDFSRILTNAVSSATSQTPTQSGSSGGAGATGSFGPTPTPVSTPTNPSGGASSGILSFIKPWNGPEVYPAVDWGGADPNIDPAILANLNELHNDFNSLNQAWQQKGYAALQAKQVYRPEAYQEHYRSIWEIFAVINNKDDTAGYLCTQTTHLDPAAVAQAYAQASAADKQTLQSLFTQHEISLGSTPAGCVSDHASGIAMDIEDQNTAVFKTSLYSSLISTAQNYGMCHNIAGDQPHFSLTDKQPAGTNCSQP